MTATKTAVFALDDIESGDVRRVEVGGHPIAVVRIDDDVYALGDICSHAHVSLSEGEVWDEDRELECPKHGSTFDLITGQPQSLPATKPVPTYDVEVVDGQVVVTVDEPDEHTDDEEQR